MPKPIADDKTKKRPTCACGHVHASHPNEGACERCKCQQYRERPRRTRGEGSFFQRADGTWIGRVELASADGERRTRTVKSKDRNVAIAKLKQLRADVDAGRIAVTTSTTVEKWMLHWIDNIHAKRKVRPGVIKDYRACIVNHINPALGKKRIDKLTPQHVRDMHTAIGPRRTAELAHVILQKALKDALREGVVVRNVAELVDKPQYAKTKRDGLPVESVKKLLSTAFASRDESEATLRAAAFLTGARPAELLGLEWDRVHLDEGYLDLSWQLQELSQVHGCGEQGDDGYPCGRKRPGWCPQRRWDLPPAFETRECHRSLIWTRPKTAAGERDVPIIAPLLTALRVLRDNSTGPNPHNLVWHRGGVPIGPRADHRAWQSLAQDAGLIGEGETLPRYVTRHTTATLLRAAGVDEQTRMEILGHATVDSQRIYAHADRTRHLEAMGNLAELLG